MNKTTILIITIGIIIIAIAGYFIWQKISSTEKNKIYLYHNPEECTLVKYSCPKGERPFSDEFGCGCEKVEEFQETKEICEIEKEYTHTAANPITCECPEGYGWEIVDVGWGPCGVPTKKDCPAVTKKCVR
jgi:hypothetical protein